VVRPKVGEIWIKNGLEREIVDVVFRSRNKPNDYDVVWRRPDEHKKHTIWLPYWTNWVSSAELVE